MSKLSVNRVVNVDVFLSPKATPRRNFGVLCVAGDSPVIDGAERIRFYTSADSVAEDFGLSAPEYGAAVLYFGQKPRPKILMVGRWLSVASAAKLTGGEPEKNMAVWQSIQDGCLHIEVDGVLVSLTGLNFSGQSNLNGVASVISGGLTSAGQSGAACVYDGTRFVIRTLATGKTAFMGYAVPAHGGTDIGGLAGLTEDKAYPPVPGFDAETPAECAAQLADISAEWYGLLFAANAPMTDQAVLDTAAFIEATPRSRIFGVTIDDPRTKSAEFKADLGTALKDRGYGRTCVCYSRVPFAAASMFGRAFTVNFNGSKTTLTLKFKQLPGVRPEHLKESEARVLTRKNINYFAQYDNDTAILEEGVMANGAFLDEIHGTDWLQDAVQNGLWNVLYQSKTKVPQTEEGATRLVTRVASVMDEGVRNGLIAPGVWRSDGFGQLQDGDFLPDGYYIYSQPIDDQPQSEREQRKAPPIQCAVKLAGAFHSVDVAINVNR